MSQLAYVVTRNPETLASYRSWLRASTAKGWPLIAVSTVLMCFGGLLLGKALVASSSLGGGAGGALILIGVLAQMFGWLRIAAFRKRYPWVAP